MVYPVLASLQAWAATNITVGLWIVKTEQCPYLADSLVGDIISLTHWYSPASLDISFT